jgi:peptidoglycan/xylan/chitin deacetylase (PgdA/CDA1 family)
MRRTKQLSLNLLRLPGATRPFAPLTRGRGAVFVLHRFQDPDNGIAGHDPERLRTALAYLRRHGYALLGMEELIRRLSGNGPPLRRAVAFTIDDGYLEQATIAAPVFAEFDCPVTTFVTTGFLDGKLWCWWDQVEFILASTTRPEVAGVLGDGRYRYELRDSEDRHEATEDFTARCKSIAEPEKLAGIASLAAHAEVDVPAKPPPQYAPMSWDQLRACEAMGMTFGPHTVSHPILARTSDEQSRAELTESWDQLREEAVHPVPVFCYPNGQWEDFGLREMATLDELGLQAAVAHGGSYAHSASFQRDSWGPFRIQRFSYVDRLPHVIQIASGFERFKEILRSEAMGFIRRPARKRRTPADSQLPDMSKPVQ